MADNEDRPVLTGLIALVAVAAVIGIIGGLAALVGSKVLGLDGDPAASAQDRSTSDASLYLPEPTITSETVEPEAPASPTVDTLDPSSSAATSEISLTAAQSSVTAMQQIDLTGTYPAGEGAILQVQQNVGDGELAGLPGHDDSQQPDLRDLRPDRPARREHVPGDRHRQGRLLQRGRRHRRLATSLARSTRRVK